MFVLYISFFCFLRGFKVLSVVVVGILVFGIKSFKMVMFLSVKLIDFFFVFFRGVCG